MSINWYPGHMKKAHDQIAQSLSQVDAVLEIRDARIPVSSRNEELDALTARKPRIIVLNKKDMADEQATEEWISSLRKDDQRAMAMEATKERPARRIYDVAAGLLSTQRAKRESRAMINREIRLLVMGIPNVGKSTLINAVAKKRTAEVGDRPGITKHERWIKTNANLLLLDTPGIMPTKLEEAQAFHLAFTGAIRDDVLPEQDVGFALIRLLMARASETLAERYQLREMTDPLLVMDEIGRKVGALVKGGEIDYTRTARRVIDDYRKLRFGRMTLEIAP